MVFQDSWWKMSTSSLAILAASAYEISCGKHIDKTNATENPIPITTVSMGNNTDKFIYQTM